MTRASRRDRRQRRRLPTLLLLGVMAVLCLTGCGAETSGLSAPEDPTTRRLLAAADRAAEVNNGKARRVEAVKTTRRQAADLDGHSNRPDEAVWVVQVSGDDYVCDVCSGPMGAEAPAGRYITLMLRAADFQGTDSGLSREPLDLTAWGERQVLRE